MGIQICKKHSRSYGLCVSASERKGELLSAKTVLIDTISRDKALRNANNLAEEKKISEEEQKPLKEDAIAKAESKEGMYTEDIPGREEFILNVI